MPPPIYVITRTYDVHVMLYVRLTRTTVMAQAHARASAYGGECACAAIFRKIPSIIERFPTFLLYITPFYFQLHCTIVDCADSSSLVNKVAGNIRAEACRRFAKLLGYLQVCSHVSHRCAFGWQARRRGTTKDGSYSNCFLGILSMVRSAPCKHTVNPLFTRSRC